MPDTLMPHFQEPHPSARARHLAAVPDQAAAPAVELATRHRWTPTFTPAAGAPTSERGIRCGACRQRHAHVDVVRACHIAIYNRRRSS